MDVEPLPLSPSLVSVAAAGVAAGPDPTMPGAGSSADAGLPPGAGFTEMLLGGPTLLGGASPGATARGLHADVGAGLRAEAARLGTGLGLASFYGVALGAREGAASIVTHALGVPATLAAVIVLGVPAFAILLGLADAPIGALTLSRAVARSAATAGLTLAGLSPIVGLFVISAEDPSAAAFAGALGLGVSCLLAMRRFALDLKNALGEAPAVTRTIASAAAVGFAVFAAVMTVRVGADALPMLGGGQ
jgi:hypothetical protein